VKIITLRHNAFFLLICWLAFFGLVRCLVLGGVGVGRGDFFAWLPRSLPCHANVVVPLHLCVLLHDWERFRGCFKPSVADTPRDPRMRSVFRVFVISGFSGFSKKAVFEHGPFRF
jgi:hypothetical protein